MRDLDDAALAEAENATLATARRVVADAENTWREMGSFDLDRPRGAMAPSLNALRHVLPIVDRLATALATARAELARVREEPRKLVPAYQDADGRLYLGVTHAQALEAAEALGATIPDDSCGGWLMSDSRYEPQQREAMTTARREEN